MLLNFTVKNYKSFANEMNFSMIASPKQNDLKYSLFEKKASGRNYKIQCSSVVYGANASGKSNIIGAMDTLKAVVLRGNIKNIEKKNPNVASSKLELIPNLNSPDGEPVEFTIEFIDDSLLFKYTLLLDLGCFLNKEHRRRIISEELYLNNKTVFKRDETIKLGEYKHLQKYLPFKQAEVEKMEEISNSSLDDEELFLTNGFKVIFSPEIVKKFTDWIEQRFVVMYRADSMERVVSFSDTDKKGIYIDSTVNKAAKIFGVNSNSLGYINTDRNSNEVRLCSIFENVDGGKVATMPAEMFESYGTVRFINLFPMILEAFANGATLVVDEFDASIHPLTLMNIINMFHNDSINQNHAQLIFNTHNPVFLNSNLFRRDEIKFVQRDNETGNSELYSLADFGTSGKNGVRNSADYMKYYFDYKYGAIEDVDFTPIFENIVGNDDMESVGGE
ncbi:MAG: ATP-binding protein [Bacteroides sp.]|nr:ATP-binding protein [Eubacterium sp.]MCM1418184.1 ATP-binding protein [Roseburia sp.]MCM1462291.1 ATP-binding protein [Bacteroides sp.]